MRKILIANRGEIAVRIVHACAEAGLTSVAVYADPDADAPHTVLADEAWTLEGSTAAETYLDGAKLLAIARRAGADAVHPGYGFLSENADFARAVVDAGLTWIGPSPETIALLGDKVAAREIARRAGAPLVPGSDGPVDSPEDARSFAQEHGLPVIIKAAHGGGGRGMRVVRELEEVEEAFLAAAREAKGAFGREECFVERFLDRPRHVEAQVAADGHGNVVVLGTRDCSLQRRHQKLVEEAPAPFLTDDQRERIAESSGQILREAGYVGVGTVEYLVAQDGLVSFLEVNTRLQVEHPVTEEVYGVDLVRVQLAVAAGEPLPVRQTPPARGHAIEFRVNAEDPGRGFLPSGGTVEAVDAPTGPGVRVDSGVRSGSRVATSFDSLLLKLVVSAPTREQALVRARTALRELRVRGVATTVPFHRAVLDAPAFAGGDGLDVWTTWIEEEFADQLSPDAQHASAEAPGRTRFTVDVDGRRVRLGIPDALAAALSSAPAGEGSPATAPAAEDGAVTAPFAGTLVSWLVSEDDDVAAGQDVAVLEAMKTETRIAAPRAGTVREIAVRPGEAVTAEQVLARLT